MNITKEDIGRKVITKSGKIGVITSVDNNPTLPVRVTWPVGLGYWYPVDGSGKVAGLTDEESITFCNENTNGANNE